MDPFLKWAGGKRWLRGEVSRRFPEWEGRYIEPFLGSGAIYFHLKPKKAALSDSNHKLIESYKAIRDRPDLVNRYLASCADAHCSEFYYSERSKSYRSRYRAAAQFIYLNRTCWNGLYRVNQQGVFNVPKGTKDKIIFENENFGDIADLLSKNVDIRCEDFEDAIDRAVAGDLVYCDPPYTIHHNLNGFLKYNENIFSWDDQVRLRAAVERAAKRGAYILVSNAGHSSLMDLYQGIGSMVQLSRASVISGKSSGRGMYGEILVEVGPIA